MPWFSGFRVLFLIPRNRDFLAGGSRVSKRGPGIMGATRSPELPVLGAPGGGGPGSRGANRSPELPVLSETGDGAPGELIEISGAIKWFDAAKGYGFIVP